MKMIQTLSMAFDHRVPVYPRVSASTSFKSVMNNLVRNPYAGGLVIDGIDGGTGAAYNGDGRHRPSHRLQCPGMLSRPGGTGQTERNPHLCRRRHRQKRQCGPERHGLGYARRLGVIGKDIMQATAGCFGNEKNRCNV